MRPFIALYVGGMGSRKQNFYNQIVQAHGFEAERRKVQDLYLEGKREEAMAALPGNGTPIDMVEHLRPAGRGARATRRIPRRGGRNTRCDAYWRSPPRIA